MDRKKLEYDKSLGQIMNPKFLIKSKKKYLGMGRETVGFLELRINQQSIKFSFQVFKIWFGWLESIDKILESNYK